LKIRSILEDGAQEPRQAAFDLDDLLELVEDERDATSSLRRELPRQLEQPLQRRVDVVGPPVGVEAEADRPVLRAHRDHGADAQAAKDA
jgi:hypothetical protein